MVTTLVTFHCYDEVPDRSNLKGEKLILAHRLWGFSLWSAGSIAFRTVKGETSRQRKVACLNGCLEAEREWSGDKIGPSRACPQWPTSSDWVLPPSFPLMTLNYESAKGLTHWLKTLTFKALSRSPTPGNQAFITHEPLGDISDWNCNSNLEQ
jgi:hypothetical protein